jgi:hypothetical protein
MWNELSPERLWKFKFNVSVYVTNIQFRNFCFMVCTGLLQELSLTGAYSPGRTFGLPFRGFLITHIQTHGRTPLDEWSAHRRGLYLHRTTQHINTTHKYPFPERDSNLATKRSRLLRSTITEVYPFTIHCKHTNAAANMLLLLTR